MNSAQENELDELITKYLQLETEKDLFVFHCSTKNPCLPEEVPLISINARDYQVINTLLSLVETKKPGLTAVMSTLGGHYNTAMQILDLLNQNYTQIEGCVAGYCMSCGTYLALNFHELYMDHETGALGAFDPQIPLPPYGNVGIYTLLRRAGLDQKNLPIYKRVISRSDDLEAHAFYYNIEESLSVTLPRGMLRHQPQNLKKVLDRFYKDTHPDYGSHAKHIYFEEAFKHIENIKRLDGHNGHVVLKRIHSLCEEIIANGDLKRIFLLNKTIHIE